MSKQKWQKDYEKPGGLVQYYASTQWTLYGKRYSYPLKAFMATAPRHTLSKLFQLCTGHGVLKSYSKNRFMAERSHYCECVQLETVEHISIGCRDCALHPIERSYLRKVSPELDSKIVFDTKKGLGAVFKFLDFLLQLLC
jgi:hypothetical protein